MQTPTQQNNHSNTIYLDLDGVLVDFDTYCYRAFGKPSWLLDHEGAIWDHIDRYECERGCNWFSDLPEMPHAQRLLTGVRAVAARTGYTIKVLTATGRNETTAGEAKRAYCVKHFEIPSEDVITVRRSIDKAAFARKGDILIDDNLERCIKPWHAAGGIAIHHHDYFLTLDQLVDYIALYQDETL